MRRGSRSRMRPSIPGSAISPRSAAPPSAWEAKVAERERAMAATSDRPLDAKGITLPPLKRDIGDDTLTYPHVRVALDRATRRAEISVFGPETVPRTVADIDSADFWPLALARELDDAILHLRFNEPGLGIIVFR